MSSQDSNPGKISQTHMALSCCSYQEALKELEEENTLLTRKLENLQIIATKHVPTVPQDNLEAEILQYLMPHANEVLITIFERAEDLAMNSEQEKTLNTLKEYLQMAINLLHLLEDLLDFVANKKKITLSKVCSLPLNVSKMLHLTFLYCKESQTFYHKYFNSLEEIVRLFKLAQVVHGKLLEVLDMHLIFNFAFQEDLLLLKLILEVLVDIGALLVDMNIRSMVLNFKAYIGLIDKYAIVLDKICEIRQPIRFFSKEILKNLELITQKQDCEVENLPQIIKLITFSLKLMLKLCWLFRQCLKTCFDELWDFLISFYSFFETQLAFKGVNQAAIALINSELFDFVDQFLNKLCYDPDFMQISNFKDVIHNNSNPIGFLILFNILLQKLKLQNNTENFDFPSALQLAFDTINKCYAEIIIDDRVYEELVTNGSAFILLNKDRYFQVEYVLHETLLSPNIWSSLMANDIWLLVLSSSSFRCKFEMLITIVERSKTIMKSNFTYSPNFNVLCNFIKSLYHASPDNVRLNFLEKFPCESYMYVWKHIGLGNFPESGRVKAMNSLLQALIEKMERFYADRCTYEEFISMCEYAETVSTINFEEVYLDVNKLSSLVLKLWDFDANNTMLVGNNFFKLYIHSLCNLSNSLVWKWTNAQLLQILQQLKLLLNTNTSMKLSVLKLLNNLSTKLIENSSERSMINSVLSDFFIVLFNDSNCVIRQATLETFIAFIKSTLHEDVVHNSLTNTKSLQESISNFMQKKLVSDPEADYVNYLKSLGEKKFIPRDLDWPTSSRQQSKKLKVENAEAVTVLQRIKSDVNYFCQLCEKKDLTQQNLSDISSVLVRLQKFI